MAPRDAKWSARDWRQFVALILLSMAAVPLTGVLVYVLAILQANPANSNAFWLGVYTATLILADLIGVSAILGRRTFRFKVGDAEVHAEGEDADELMERAE